MSIRTHSLLGVLAGLLALSACTDDDNSAGTLDGGSDASLDATSRPDGTGGPVHVGDGRVGDYFGDMFDSGICKAHVLSISDEIYKGRDPHALHCTRDEDCTSLDPRIRCPSGAYVDFCSLEMNSWQADAGQAFIDDLAEAWCPRLEPTCFYQSACGPKRSLCHDGLCLDAILDDPNYKP